jgi:hypothetical protein
MRDISAITRQLAASAQAMRALLETVPPEQAEWKPDAQTWSLKETMQHLYNEERLDFRKHLREMFHVPPQPWGESKPKDEIAVESLAQALDGFLTEREVSLAYLRGLAAADWEITFQAPWGALKVGDVLVSWVEHDFLHLRQLNEVHHAWNVHTSRPYSTDYAGGW